jgi:hypothetical protein
MVHDFPLLPARESLVSGPSGDGKSLNFFYSVYLVESQREVIPVPYLLNAYLNVDKEF